MSFRACWESIFGRLLAVLAAVFFCLAAQAHVGSPNAVVEGRAGPYFLRVFVRPPTVVPGVAEITVRVLEGHADTVTVLPVYWQTGRAGAPTPDTAKPVPGETNLFSGGLWLMKSGAYSIDVHAAGSAGDGTLVVPVNSLATNTKPMTRAYSLMLMALGAILVANLIKIVGKVFGESLAGPEGITPRSKRTSRIAMAVGALAITGILYGGKGWWDQEENDYRSNRLYRPVKLEASITNQNQWPFLRLRIDGKSRRSDSSPLLPDHGKIMHVFAVKRDGLDAFAHIHPVSAGSRTYQTPVPPLPPGEYEIYADVTHENGLSETWTATAVFPEPSKLGAPLRGNPNEAVCAMPVAADGKALPFDPDDSWHLGKPLSDGTTPATFALPEGRQMKWLNQTALHADEEAVLQFQLFGADGQPAPINNYMGMAGHAALRCHDGSVFAHLHPGGTISMASQAYFLRRDATNAAPDEAAATVSDHLAHASSTANPGVPEKVSFPYSFPKGGNYRIWVQMKSGEQVYTGVFDASVAARGGLQKPL